MQTTLKVLVAAVALAVAWHVGRATRVANPAAIEVASQPTAPPLTFATRTAPLRSRLVRDGQFRGLAIQLHGGRDVYDKYHRLIPEVADLGADTVLLVVPAWQDHAGSLDLHMDAHKTPDAQEVGKLCDLARDHGLRVILMPIVLLSNPRNNEWRGRIVPSDRDWNAWFKRYTQFVLHFAKTAERHRAEVFMVGSELIKAEPYTEQWRRIIAEVRQHYRGKLAYSANWDHYQIDKIGFWPELDYVGMTSYYELAAGPNPTIEELDAKWAKFKERILTFQREVRKPIIFTEVGWCSQEGAAHEGWNYYANQNATEAGHREQALLYESFIKTWARAPGVGGIIWWEWDLTKGGDDDHGYTPRGKPAERILREWFAGRASKPERQETTDE